MQTDRAGERRVLGLDLLRAVAITWVVVAHAEFILRPVFPKMPTIWILDAVDLFFVLSGFLIGRIILRDVVARDDQPPFQLLRMFWMRRWLRTLPAYYATFLACFMLFKLFPGTGPGLTWKYLVFLQNMWTPHPGFMANAWSLSIEEYYYLLFPLAIVAPSMLFRHDRRRAYLFAALLFMLAPLLLRFWLARTLAHPQLPAVWEGMCHKLIPTRLDAIAYGALGAWMELCHAGFWKRRAAPLALLGLAVLVAACVLPFGWLARWTVSLSMTSLGVALLLPALSLFKDSPEWFAAPVRHISKHSYSMYLVHYPLILVPILALARHASPRTAILWCIAYYLAVMLLSYALYYIIERPGLMLRKHITRRWAVRHHEKIPLEVAVPMTPAELAEASEPRD